MQWHQRKLRVSQQSRTEEDATKTPEKGKQSNDDFTSSDESYEEEH